MKIKYDKLTRTTGLQQLRVKKKEKKNCTKKQNHNSHSNNIEDNFQEIENLVMNNDAFVISLFGGGGERGSAHPVHSGSVQAL